MSLCRLFLAVICLGAGLAPAESSATANDWFTWTDAAPMPERLGACGAFVGPVDGRLVVAGGVDFPVSGPDGGHPRYLDAIGVFEQPGDEPGRWSGAGRLATPTAYGAAVATPRGLVCLGGRDATGLSDRVFVIGWDANRKTFAEIAALPPLPEACEHPAAAVLGNKLYVAGGRGSDGATGDFWVLDWNAASEPDSPVWRVLPSWPGPPRFGAVLAAQSDGERNVLHLFGGRSDIEYLRDAYRYDPAQPDPARRWTPLAEMPRPAAFAPAVAWGQSHVLVLGGNDVLAYHTITDTWTTVGELPRPVAGTAAVPWRGGIVLPGGQAGPEACTPAVIEGCPQPFPVTFGLLDHAALGGYLVAMLAVGLYFTRREKTSDDFFLAGRRIPWWAAGLSLLATQVSSIGFMAIPAKTYATDWAYFAGVGTWFLVVPLVARAYIPFFRRLNVTSAYEYLELRFHVSVRLFGTVVYSLLQLGRMAVVLYLPALALAAVTGIDTITSILIMGVLCTAYTVAGGIEAVVWTEVAQAALMLGGALACVIVVIAGIDGGPGRFLEIAAADHKFQLAQSGWSCTTASLWVVLVGNVFTRLGGLTSDQAVVQRYLITPDEATARRALWTDVLVSIPWAVLVFLLGTALYVFYKLHPDMLSPSLDTDAVVPLFVAQKMPAGLSGLIIAAVFAAAMSTLQSSMHSVATIWVTDVYARFHPRGSDRSRLRLARLLTLSLGAFAIGAAVWMASADIRSLWDQFLAIVGLFIGGLSGLFVLGIFTRRASAAGAMVGALASGAVLWYVVLYTDIHFFLYSAIGCLTCWGVGYLVSLVRPHRRRLEGLTVYAAPLDARTPGPIC